VGGANPTLNSFCTANRVARYIRIAAGVLQKAGFINDRRGEVKILNKRKLEETSCECYKIIQQQIEKWRSESP